MTLLEEARALAPSPHVAPLARNVIRRMAEALELIADGSLGPEQHAHYLAHRAAVKVARNTLKSEAV